jgi:hypothetical protein
MRRHLALALLLALAPLALAGCASCASEPVPAEVALALQAEEARTLPILASGATHLAGLSLPDSHGWLDLQMNVSHDIPGIEVDDLRLTAKVAEQEVPVALLKVDGGRGWSQQQGGRTWAGQADDGAVLRLWWAVDREQVESVQQLRLAEGAVYEATVDFAWRHTGCGPTAHGHVTQAFSDFVEASVNARTFSTVGEPSFEATAAGAGFKADYRIRSGLEVTVDRATALAVILKAGPASLLGVATFPHVGTLVNGIAGTHVKPGDALRAQSTAAGVGQVYAPSGVMTPAGMSVRGGLVVLLVELGYTPGDPTLGAQSDRFAYGITPG